jgi:hypothetical protein
VKAAKAGGRYLMSNSEKWISGKMIAGMLGILLAILMRGLNAFYMNEVKTPIPPELSNGILELSKPTLGAFIGSYVARARNNDNKGGSRENSAK